jgi:hypothetical protein
MRNVALLTLLILPIISQDTLADNLPSSIRRAVELKRANSFCELTDPKKTSLNEQAKAINKGRSTELSTTVLNDLEAADTACTPESRDAEAEARKDIVAQAAEFPVQILANTYSSRHSPGAGRRPSGDKPLDLEANSPSRPKRLILRP